MSGTESEPDRFNRLQPRNWSLAVKLAAVLAVPIVLAMTLGVLRVADQINNAADLGARDRFVVLQERVSTLIDHLQRERDQSSVFVAGNRTGDRSVLKTVFGAVDGAMSDTQAAIGDPASLGGGPETAYRQVKDNLSRLAQLRDQVTGTGIEAPAVISQYTGLVEPLLGFESALDRQLNTPALAGLATGLSALNSAREQIALAHAVIAVAITRGEMLAADADTVRATDARLGTAVDQFRAGLDVAQQKRFAGWATSPANEQRQQLKQAALSRVGARGQLGLSATEWDSGYESVLEELRTAESGVRDEIKSISVAQQNQAHNAAILNSVILVLGLLSAAAVVYLIGRSLLEPLRVLRSAALDVAERRLPEAVRSMRAGRAPDVAVEPVPVATREEIGQVARAFDAVHGQALRLAAEQATLQANVSSMFVNLSRRSQGLVERQLRLIEQLERNEQDSEQLANLFQLDHLATRMRRNSENLLVLAGSDLARRANQQVPVVDVLRAAVSEIEQYQRVVVQTPPGVQILGRAASDLVHLVAELLDNATSFSAPETQVVVSSSLGPDGSVLVEIADRGVGMAGEELITANNRLGGPSEVDVSASRRMGLFVVGRLASRHGIGVRLASSDPARGASAGVTASVNVPSYLVGGEAATERPDAPQPTQSAQSADPGRGADPADPAESGAFSAFVPDLVGAGNGAAPARGNGTAAGTNGSPNGRSSASPDRGSRDGSPLHRREPPAEPVALPRRSAGAALSGPADQTAAPAEGTAGSARVGGSPAPTMPEPPRRPEEGPRQPPQPVQPPRWPLAPQPPRTPGGHRLEESEPVLTVPPVRTHPPAGPSEGLPDRTRPPAERRPALVEAGQRKTGESPIFEEMASAWFRENWQVEQSSKPVAGAESTPVPSRGDQGDREPAAGPPDAGLMPAPSVPAPPLPPEPGWGDESTAGPVTPSDPDGWDRGEPLLRPMPDAGPSELTAAGLPKRVPRSQLIPGVSASGASEAVAAPAPVRSAEQVRGRLASYQQGVRRGRESRLRGAGSAGADTSEEAR